MSYVLISPIKDEERNIELLVSTIVNQTIKPSLWVIVDSNSSDNSFEVSREFSKEYNWIHAVKQEKLFEKGYGHKNFAQAVNEGYEHAKYLCNLKMIKFDYVGKVDAAISLQKNYFEFLMDEMEQNENLAFTCGILFTRLKDNKIKFKPSNLSKLAGVHDMRLYRKDFFEKVGGYPLSYSPDTILSIKTLNEGFDFRVVERTYCEKLRVGGIGGSKIGIWSAYKIKGNSMYYLGYNLTFTFLNAVYNAYKFSPHYQAIPLLYGYVNSFMKQKDKIDDQDVLNYFKERKIKNVLKSYVKGR